MSYEITPLSSQETQVQVLWLFSFNDEGVQGVFFHFEQLWWLEALSGDQYVAPKSHV